MRFMKRWEKLESDTSDKYRKVEELTDSGNDDEAMKAMPKAKRAYNRLNAYKRRKKIDPYASTFSVKHNLTHALGNK